MKHHHKVLIVDDDIAIVNIVNKFLTVKGYEAFAAYDGLAGIALFKAIGPDVVLLDQMLPELSGIQVLKHMKETNPSVPIVMLTGVDDPGFSDTVIRMGAESCLRKPVRLATLERTLANALNVEDPP
jgi:DNA-binding response OmpR family regulator